MWGNLNYATQRRCVYARWPFGFGSADLVIIIKIGPSPCLHATNDRIGKHLDLGIGQVVCVGEGEGEAGGVGAAALREVAVVVAHAWQEANAVAAPHQLAAAALLHSGLHLPQHLALVVHHAQRIGQSHLFIMQSLEVTVIFASQGPSYTASPGFQGLKGTQWANAREQARL